MEIKHQTHQDHRLETVISLNLHHLTNKSPLLHILGPTVPYQNG